MRSNQFEYGYARVSSRDQNEDRQLIALRAFGIKDKNIYLDKVSGKDFNRPQYKRMLKKIKKGDLLVLSSLDRLGRNYKEMQEQWWMITKKIGADVLVLDMPLLDTRRDNKNLTDIFLSDMVLQLLSYVAQSERERIRQRQREGIDAAIAKGKQFGRPKLDRPKNYRKVLSQWQQGEINSRKAGELLGVGQRTFLRWKNADMGLPVT